MKILVVLLMFATSGFAADEMWKGKMPESSVEVSALTGIVSHGSRGALGVLLGGSFVIVPEGWVEDVTERIALDLHFGPALFDSQSSWLVLPNLKWEFFMDDRWSFSALAGVGAFFLSSSQGGGGAVFPNIALGGSYQTKSPVNLQFQVSHAFTGVGFGYQF